RTTKTLSLNGTGHAWTYAQGGRRLVKIDYWPLHWPLAHGGGRGAAQAAHHPRCFPKLGTS
ncbi:MAG: hypothetical protein ACI965_000060, partial [Paraglaciecola sp.]